MDNIIIFIAQLFGGLAALFGLLSSWQKTRKRIFLFLIFDNVFYMIQYLLLGAYTGVVINIIGLFRLYLFNNKKKYKKYNRLPLYLILALYLISGYFTYENIYCLLPIIASLVYASALWNDSPKVIRIGSALIAFCWGLYNLFVSAYLGALIEVIVFISTLIAIYNLNFKKIKK